MCIILPVSHTSCNHTIFIWQHCIDATRYGINGQTPCYNVQQHGQVVFSRKLCENCGGERHFARRGGVAERGNGRSPSTLEDDGEYGQEDAHDSGYNSDAIHEEVEESDLDDLPISPKAITPRRLQTKQRIERKSRASSNSRPSGRRPSWKPNLKRELTFEDVPISDRTRRNSIDSLISNFDGNIWDASRERQAITETNADTIATGRDLHVTTETSTTRKHHLSKRRLSTLLHPSSPSSEITVGVQTARAFAFPQLVDIQKSSGGSASRTPTRKRSSLMHPSTPVMEVAMELHSDFSGSPTENSEDPATWKDSTLRHPFPTVNFSNTDHHQTVISVPTMQHETSESPLPTLLHLSPSPSSLRQFSFAPARRLPILLTDKSAAVFNARGTTQCQSSRRPRRESILHSSLSDSEDDAFSESPQSSQLSYYKLPWNTQHASDEYTMSDYDAEDAEGAILTNTARVARASRNGVRNG